MAHKISIEPSAKRVRVMVNGETIADSIDTMLLLETGLGPVYYFPRADVRSDLLRATDHHSHCPLKGDARYWSIDVAGRAVENAVWCYETPLAGAEAIAGRLAFYWNKVDRIVVERTTIAEHAADEALEIVNA